MDSVILNDRSVQNIRGVCLDDGSGDHSLIDDSVVFWSGLL